jgi:predicted DNA-binding transcriptional regulator AlpA
MLDLLACVTYEVLYQFVPYTRTHIDRLEHPEEPTDDPFPQRVRLGKGSRCRVCWILGEVLAWRERQRTRNQTSGLPRGETDDASNEE